MPSLFRRVGKYLPSIALSRDRSLRVLGVRDDDADQPPALVVEDMAE